jgi:hypothetical protein
MERSNFTYEGLEVLFNYLEELEDIELDVIAFCSDYSEEKIETIIEYYSIDCGGLNEDEKNNYVKKYLENATTVLGFTDTTIIYQQF